MSNERFILVTGGAGYIGSHTVVELVSHGYQPIIADDFRNSSESVIDGITKITGQRPIVFNIDITEPRELETVFQQYPIYGVIHFAAYKAVGESVAHPLLYYRNNLVSLLTLLELTEKYKVEKLVFSSSCTVYGEPKDVSVDEEAEIQEANSPYGATKQMSERMIVDLHNSSSNTGFVSLRYFNPVGAHSSGWIGELPLGKPNNLLPYVTQTGAGVLEELTIFGNDYNTNDGTCIRDYIHVVDLADAHVKALEWLEGNPGKYEVFNIGTGIGSSVLEIVHTFEEVSGKKLKWRFGPRRSGDVEKIYAEVGKAEKLLNWKAKYSIEDAVRDAWNWERRLRNV